MQARFVGKDRSMGYRHGQVYDIAVSEWSPMQPVILRPIRCPYGSYQAFYDNWTPLAWELDNTPAVE